MQLRQIKNLFSRQPNRADPSHAFGSEEQLLREFQQQNYVQPRTAAPEGRGFSGRTGRAAPRRPVPEAPVYSAETYQQESAPDLGWEAAFAPREAPPPPPEEPKPTAGERFETFRRTVYATPPQPSQSAPPPPNYGAFPPGAYYRQRSAAPVYQEIHLQGEPRRQRDLAKPVYEDLTFTQSRPGPAQSPRTAPGTGGGQNGPAPRGAAPQEQAPQERNFGGRTAPRERNFGGQTAPPEGFAYTGGAGETDSAFAPRDGGETPGRAPARPGVARMQDWQYYCWSGSIVAGAALTLFGLIYACFI